MSTEELGLIFAGFWFRTVYITGACVLCGHWHGPTRAAMVAIFSSCRSVAMRGLLPARQWDHHCSCVNIRVRTSRNGMIVYCTQRPCFRFWAGISLTKEQILIFYNDRFHDCFSEWKHFLKHCSAAQTKTKSVHERLSMKNKKYEVSQFEKAPLFWQRHLVIG